VPVLRGGNVWKLIHVALGVGKEVQIALCMLPLDGVSDPLPPPDEAI
jgi:hypothetical protein